MARGDFSNAGSNIEKAAAKNAETHFDNVAREAGRHVCREHGKRAKAKRTGRGLKSGVEFEVCCEDLRAEVVRSVGGR